MEPPVSSEKSLSIRKLQAPGDGFKFSKILIASQKNDFLSLAMVTARCFF